MKNIYEPYKDENGVFTIDFDKYGETLVISGG